MPLRSFADFQEHHRGIVGGLNAAAILANRGFHIRAPGTDDDNC
jgi:hypothetical protein